MDDYVLFWFCIVFVATIIVCFFLKFVLLWV